MIVVVNGEEREVPEGLSVAGLLEHLAVEAELVAVELDREVVPRDRHSKTPVRPGSRLEVVTFTGGG